jgi:hypothetical protein
MIARCRVTSLSGSPRWGKAVTSRDPTRLPRPKAATSVAPPAAPAPSFDPRMTATTESAPPLTAVSMLAMLTRRSGPWLAMNRSVLRTPGASGRDVLDRSAGGSVSVAIAAANAATASIIIAPSAALPARP